VSHRTPGLHKYLAASGLALLIPIVLTKLYAAFTPVVGTGWVSAALWHTVLAIIILWQRPYVIRQFGPKAIYALPLLVVLGSVCLAAASQALMPHPQDATVTGLDVAWVLWIPLVEEVVFRLGIGRIFTRLLPGLGGLWFSSLTFALAHVPVTFSGLLHGDVGVPLGPFLLGLICQTMIIRLRSIWPSILMHMACNGTAVIFRVMDGRWLSWLGALYV
jgi:membrane protease YdiL (CAAX protease family)